MATAMKPKAGIDSSAKVSSIVLTSHRSVPHPPKVRAPSAYAYSGSRLPQGEKGFAF